MIPVVLALIGLILIGLAMTMPWYEARITTVETGYYESYRESTIEMDFDGVEVDQTSRDEWGNDDYSYGFDWDDSDMGLDNMADLYNNVGLAAFLTLIIATAAFAFFGMTLHPRFRTPSTLRTVVALSIIIMIIVLATTIHYVDEHPKAWRDDTRQGFLPETEGPWATFSGHDSAGPNSTTWGPAIGFYLFLAGGSLFVVAALFFAITFLKEIGDGKSGGRSRIQAHRRSPPRYRSHRPKPVTREPTDQDRTDFVAPAAKVEDDGFLDHPLDDLTANRSETTDMDIPFPDIDDEYPED